MKNKLLLSLISTISLFSTLASATEIATNSALMQAMDKITGRVNKITVPVNSKITFGDFSLVLRACKKRPAEETPENFAFIDVADKSFGEDEYNIFRGWIVSSTPGLNAIEHPIYDVWLLECVDKEVDVAKLLTEEELANRDSLQSKKDIQQQVSQTESTDEQVEPKSIHIKDFITEDRDIEKDIKEFPTYISESSTSYVSDIEEGEEPENLLQFTKMQEDTEPSEKIEENKDEDLTKSIDAELKKLSE